MDFQTDHHQEEFDITPESYEYAQIGYVPFGSLRHPMVEFCIHKDFI